MGSVCSSEKKPKDRPLQPTHTKLESAVEVNDDVPTGPDENLLFKVQIDTIKARNIPTSTTRVQINFAKQRKFSTSKETLYSTNYNWNMKEEFEFETTRHSLWRQKIELILLDGYDKEIGSVAIKLHDIVTGPPELDYAVNMAKGAKEAARLNFQVKMFQMIHMSIKTKQIQCKINDGLKDRLYNFSLKVKTKEGEFLSESSEDFVNQNAPPNTLELENYQFTMEEGKNLKMKSLIANSMDLAEARGVDRSNDDVPDLNNLDKRLPSISPLKEKSKSTVGQSVLLGKKAELGWSYQDGNKFSPVLEIDVNIKELVSGSFQFFLWTNKEVANPAQMIKNPDAEDSGEVYIDHKLIAECYIGMNKFFFGQAEINFGEDRAKLPAGIEATSETKVQNGKSGQTRDLKFTEKLWFSGVEMGEFTGEFVLYNSSFYKQMIMGVRNEDGIQKISSMYSLGRESETGFAKGNSDNKEIKNLEANKAAFKTMMFNLANPKIQAKERSQLLGDLKENLFKITENLRNLNQNVALNYVDNPDGLLNSQTLLVHLGRNILDNIEEIVHTVRPWCFESLNLLINRGELDLNFMGFTGAYANYIKTGKSTAKITDKIFARKVEVCQDYQALLANLLKRTINKMNDKALPQKEKDFVEIFNAQAYFRIPEFREKLLEEIGKEDAKEILKEWRGTEWALDEKADGGPPKKNQYFLSLFDWEKDFYNYLKTTEQGKKNHEFLLQVLESKEWLEKISKKGVAYYQFLIEWTNYVERIVIIKEHVPWQDIPGYTKLLKSFLIDLKNKDVRHYPESLVQASCSLLKNEKLFGTFVSILYRKTKIYDSSNVFAVYETINKWFNVLIENGKSIPSTFDFGFFFKGLFMVMEGEHALNVAITLLVIYNNFNLFPSTEKGFISDQLLDKLFFKLFLNWSWSVRQVFHHLLIYRFYHQHRYANTNLTNLEDLRKEFLQYNQKRESLDKTKTLLINDYINMTYARNMTIIENAYQKYTEEKKQAAYQKKFKSKLKPLAKPRYASAVNLTEFLVGEDGKDNQKTTDIKNKHVNEQKYNPDRDKKKTNDRLVPINSNDTSVTDTHDVIINPDQLDSTPSNGLGIRPTRSESVSMNQVGFMQNGETRQGENLNSNDSKYPDKDGKYEAIKDKKKVIYRRFKYFDKQTNELKEIPKEFLVYLQASFEEFEKIKEQYLKWLVANKSSTSKKEDNQNAKVPELIVKIPLDDNEDQIIESEDW